MCAGGQAAGYAAADSVQVGLALELHALTLHHYEKHCSVTWAQGMIPATACACIAAALIERLWY